MKAFPVVHFQEGFEGSHRFAAFVGHHKQFANDVCALRQRTRLLRHLELHHDVIGGLSRLLRGSLLLLSQWRGDFNIKYPCGLASLNGRSLVG